jgi:2'-5' RNA ligase
MMARYFIGVMVPPDTARSIWAAASEKRDEAARRGAGGVVVDWTPAESLHLTLLYLGEVEDLGALESEAEEPAGRLDPFTVRIDGSTRWLGDHLVLPVSGSDRAGQALHGELGHLSSDPSIGHRSYLGHVTLGQISLRPRLEAPRLDGSWAWRADCLQLIESRGGQRRARYSTTTTFALGAS